MGAVVIRPAVSVDLAPARALLAAHALPLDSDSPESGLPRLGIVSSASSRSSSIGMAPCYALWRRRMTFAVRTSDGNSSLQRWVKSGDVTLASSTCSQRLRNRFLSVLDSGSSRGTGFRIHCSGRSSSDSPAQPPPLG
jgi:hypothetical protein